MNKKIILFSLVLLNLKMVCGEISAMPPAVTCEISYDDVAINRLMKSNTEYNKYGFDGYPLCLCLNEKNRRGFISTQNDLLERLKISKEQALNLITIGRERIDCSSSADLKSAQYRLENPIYVMTEKDGTPIFYIIKSLRLTGLETSLDDAGYNSGLEERQLSFLAGGALGTFLGIVLGGTIATIFMYCVALRKIFSR